MHFVTALKQLVPTSHLRITRISDFYPRRIAVFDCVAAVSMLANNAFKVALAYQLEKALAVCLDVIDVKQVVGVSWHDPSQRSLAFNERQIAEVAAIHPEEVERAETGYAASEKERIELGTAVLIQTRGFSVENDGGSFQPRPMPSASPRKLANTLPLRETSRTVPRSA